MAAEFCFEDARGKRLLVALSGGADSVALLCLLAERRNELTLQLTAAHLHHGIRGAEADADARYCREICAQLGVELIEGCADIPRIARETGRGLETIAREERYRFLYEAKEKCGAELIALAHHLNDQAETMLMHLFRGTGPEGICGMERLRDGLYRPLLDIPKEELRKYLQNRGIGWREDQSNGISDNPRNALRLNVLPEIEKSYPRAAEAIARYGRIARIESDFLARMTEAFLEKNLESGPYGRRLHLEEIPDEAILRRTLRSICPVGTDARKLDALAELAASRHGKMEISGGLSAEKTGGWLYFLPKGNKKPAAVPLTMPGETILPGICRIVAELGDFSIAPGTEQEVLDAKALSGAVLRTRQEGDRIRPLGCRGEKLLSDHLTDKKMDRPLRDFLPIICAGNRVLWTGGAGISEDAKVIEGTTCRIRITIHK